MESLIDGVINFRSVAPYKAGAGRVKQNALYRSGTFEGIQNPGLVQLSSIGVTAAFDLRNMWEKENDPSPLLAVDGFDVISISHDIYSGDLAKVLADPNSTAQAARQTMTSIYSRLPSEFTNIYRQYFLTLLKNSGPTAIHCTAGKDRTGVAIAILLDILGVSRDDIMEDYLKTNAAQKQLFNRFRRHSKKPRFTALAGNVIEPVITAHPDYLHTMFKEIDTQFGGSIAYMTQALALSSADKARLEDILLA